MAGASVLELPDIIGFDQAVALNNTLLSDLSSWRSRIANQSMKPGRLDNFTSLCILTSYALEHDGSQLTWLISSSLFCRQNVRVANKLQGVWLTTEQAYSRQLDHVEAVIQRKLIDAGHTAWCVSKTTLSWRT